MRNDPLRRSLQLLRLTIRLIRTANWTWKQKQNPPAPALAPAPAPAQRVLIGFLLRS